MATEKNGDTFLHVIKPKNDGQSWESGSTCLYFCKNAYGQTFENDPLRVSLVKD